MSNLVDLLNDISTADTNPIQLSGNLIGTLADLSGAKELLDLLDNLIGQAGESKSAVDAIQEALRKDLAELGELVKANAIIAWQQHFDQPMSASRAAVQALKLGVTTSPPISEEARLKIFSSWRRLTSPRDISNCSGSRSSNRASSGYRKYTRRHGPSSEQCQFRLRSTWESERSPPPELDITSSPLGTAASV
jgi:hypothetical protein